MKNLVLLAGPPHLNEIINLKETFLGHYPLGVYMQNL